MNNINSNNSHKSFDPELEYHGNSKKTRRRL